MKNFDKGNNILKIIFYIYFLTIVLFSFFISPLKISAVPKNVIIGPISVLGEINSSEKQILFNRFREQINKRYNLVSHKVLELISEQGLISFDIEDCNNSRCVRIILKFLNNLHQKYSADDLFLLQLVRNKSDTQLSLKLSSLSIPEVTKNIVNTSCSNCDIEKLKITIDIIVKEMFAKLGLKELEIKRIDENSKMEISEKKLPSSKKILEKDNLLENKLTPSKKSSISESVKKPEIDVEQILEKPTSDPYIVDRDLYNQHIGRLLTDVTYALQIFRSGMFVQIEVSIDPSGTVVNQRIVKSSGSNDFDDTAISTLEEIQFEPLPDTMLKYGDYIVNLQIHNSR